jgi:hypothetical protein
MLCYAAVHHDGLDKIMGNSTCPWYYCPREIGGVLMAVYEHRLIVFMSFMTLFCDDLVAVIFTLTLVFKCGYVTVFFHFSFLFLILSCSCKYPGGCSSGLVL